MKITIVDYQLSNIFSVRHAFENIGCEVEISSSHKDIKKAEALILPGVGAFGEAMKNLKDLGLIDSIRSYIDDERPFFGVCLGMQLLFDKSGEFGAHEGLGIIGGEIKKFPVKAKMKVPQVGWKPIYPSLGGKKFEKEPFKNVVSGEYMYFVHSYFVCPANDDDMLSVSSYGDMQYCSSVKHKNIIATQFHPERSGQSGLDVYRNWVENIKRS
ncbi:MAG: imidazole glycerol phosphate synthase subunit HisH [Cyclobacteriaceae bacterium]|nr:imidazole glycerol phosphate synthase subunit HisH [Cyclobacteriaceae bacterium HetDA_MAG_MS6]